MAKRVLKNETKSGLLYPLIVGVVLLLVGGVVGGASPWWYEKFFPSKPTAVPQSSPVIPQSSPVIHRDITGRWSGGTGIYNVTQTGNQVVWDGYGKFGNKTWHHTAKGSIEGDTIRAIVEELPDSYYPGDSGGFSTEGTLSSDGQTITWTGQSDQERVWRRGA